MLYLVKGRVQIRRYMADRHPPAEEEIRIVEADDVWSAADKFTAHFQDKGSDHDDHYWVEMVEAHPIIV